jgi:autotransporter adhesin
MADISLPQLGSPAVLTLQGSPIQLSQLTVSMNQDGSISNITTKDSSTLTQIFNSLASSFTTVSTQENATIQAQATSLTAKNGTVTAQSSLLTAQNSTTTANAALLTAQNGTTTANASALTAQTAAAAAQAQANDQLLKAQADCLLQYKAVVQAGGVPVANCQ